MLMKYRALLFDDGGSSTSVCGLSTSTVPPPGSKGTPCPSAFLHVLTSDRSQSSGMASAFYTTVMVPLSMPKRLSRRS